VVHGTLTPRLTDIYLPTLNSLAETVDSVSRIPSRAHTGVVACAHFDKGIAVSAFGGALIPVQRSSAVPAVSIYRRNVVRRTTVTLPQRTLELGQSLSIIAPRSLTV
jgi:hypothetical protein